MKHGGLLVILACGTAVVPTHAGDPRPFSENGRPPGVHALDSPVTADVCDQNPVCETAIPPPASASGGLIAMNRVQTLSTEPSIILSRASGFDLDHDGHREFVVKRKQPLLNGTFEFYESTGNDTVGLAHVLVASADNIATLVQSDAGDADGDGRAELTMYGQFNPRTYVAQVYESLSSSTYPTKRVWNVGAAGFPRGVKIADTDGDGIRELVIGGKGSNLENRIVIYENDGNNSYSQTYSGGFSEIDSAQSMVVADDLDGDARPEILFAGLTSVGGSKIFMVESVGNNAYRETWSAEPTYGNGLVANFNLLVDCEDLDGDGRKEFLLGGLGGGAPGMPYDLVLFLFEAVGDNQFQVVHVFLQPYGSLAGGRGAVIADVDGDGKREVIFASGYVLRMYRNTGDNSWQEIWTGATGELYSMGAGDHDADGKEEIIFQGTGGGTEIWEIDPAYASDPDGDGLVDVIDNCPGVANAGQADTDGDKVGNACDCAPGDASASAVPIEVSGLGFQANKTKLAWASQAAASGAGTTYDVIRGSLVGLPVGSSVASCLEGASLDTTANDDSIPLPGAGFYYLARGDNVCGSGTYGTDSSGGEQVSVACR
jgi:hypothetical protein